jgi:transcriptional regulator with XRE-family HTH domain
MLDNDDTYKYHSGRRMTPIREFGLRLKALREARGMSQAQLAKMATVSRGYLSRVELGMQSPTLHVIERLAAALAVRPLELLEDQARTERRSTKRTR